MKEYMKEDLLTIETLKTKIWSMFDILRSERINSDDYHVLLFLLSAYKDGLFGSELFNERNNLNETLIRQLYSSDVELSNQYVAILPIFEPIVLRLSERGIRGIINIFMDLNTVSLDEKFTEIFDAVLYRIAQSQGKAGGEFIQPIELTRFICSLAELHPNSRVYNLLQD